MIALTHAPYAVERMTLEDIATVAAIEDTTFSLPWSATAFRYEIVNNRASEYCVLRYTPWQVPGESRGLAHRFRRVIERPALDRSIIGYGGQWVIIDEAHISTIAVAKPWRGRGLGELLLASMIERAAHRGAELVTLEVRVSNTVAQGLYKKYGFEIVGRRKRYYGDNGEDAHIMNAAPINTDAYRQRLRTLSADLCRRLDGAVVTPPEEDPGSDHADR